MPALSVIEPLWDRLLAFDSTTLGSAQLVYKAFLRTWKVDGLRKILGGNAQAKQALQENAIWMRQFQTNEGISLIDDQDTLESSGSASSFSGIAEALRAYGVAHGVPTAILSRGLAGTAGRTLVVNLPGSTGGVRDGLAVLADIVLHALDQIPGSDHGTRTE